MPFCSKCGAKLQTGSKFCNKCGTPLAAKTRKPRKKPKKKAPKKKEETLGSLGAKLWGGLKKKAKATVDEYQRKQNLRSVLEKLDKEDLVALAQEYDVPATKKQEKSTILDALVKDKDITQEEAEEFADSVKGYRRVRGREEEIEQEIVRTERITTTVRRKDNTLRQLEKGLKRFRPIVGKRIRERSLEKQMVQSLWRLFGEERVNYQQRSGTGRPDIVVDDRYAIELKLISSYAELRGMIGQVTGYAKSFDQVIIWIYDRRRALKPAELRSVQRDFRGYGFKNIEVMRGKTS